MVPPVSDRIPPVPPYSGSRLGWHPCAYGALTLCRRPSQTVPLRMLLRVAGPTTPDAPQGPRFGLLPVRSPLLGESLLISVPALLRWFTSPRSPPLIVGIRHLCRMGCPIRKSPDRRPFAPPRSLSQLVTSFLAVKSQGIPCAPLVTYSIYSLFLFRRNRLIPARPRFLRFLLNLLPACQRTFPRGLPRLRGG